MSMTHVNIYKLQNDGSQEILAVCRLGGDNTTVVCESSNNVFIQNLAKEGIRDYSDSERKQLFLTDGRKFLEQLKFNFNSGYLNASDIIEE